MALVDAGRLPRFSLGESLTPHAAALLEAVAARFRLPWIAPLLDPAAGDRPGPGVRSGRNRGSTWLPAPPDAATGTAAGRGTAADPLTVRFTGSRGAHWHRGDADAFAAARAVAADVLFYDRTALHAAEPRRGGGYMLTGTREEPGDLLHRRSGSSADPMRSGPMRSGLVQIEADFVIDAGPPGGVGRGAGDPGLAGLLGLPDEAGSLATRTTLTFAHVSGLDPPALSETSDADPAWVDETAVHHLLDDGWYRETRFADGAASVARAARWPGAGSGRPARPPTRDRLADPYQLDGRGGGLAARQGRSTHAGPGAGPFSTGRFQRRVGRLAGADYALLPAAAAAIDPLHDPDLAHTALAALRLCAILETNWARPTLNAELTRYAVTLDREIARIDGLTAPTYAALGDWDTFRLAVGLHDAASVGAESAGLRAGEDGGEFLMAEDDGLTAAATAFAAGIGRLNAAELAAELRTHVPNVDDRFFAPA